LSSVNPIATTHRQRRADRSPMCRSRTAPGSPWAARRASSSVGVWSGPIDAVPISTGELSALCASIARRGVVGRERGLDLLTFDDHLLEVAADGAVGEPLIAPQGDRQRSNWLKWVGPSIGAPSRPSEAAVEPSWTLAWLSTSARQHLAGERKGPLKVISVGKRMVENLPGISGLLLGGSLRPQPSSSADGRCPRRVTGRGTNATSVRAPNRPSIGADRSPRRDRATSSTRPSPGSALSCAPEVGEKAALEWRVGSTTSSGRTAAGPSWPDQPGRDEAGSPLFVPASEGPPPMLATSTNARARRRD